VYATGHTAHHETYCVILYALAKCQENMAILPHSWVDILLLYGYAQSDWQYFRGGENYYSLAYVGEINGTWIARDAENKPSKHVHWCLWNLSRSL